MAPIQFSEEIEYLEIHPTNMCIFKCPWCTYLQFGSRQGQSLNMDSINKALKLNPEFILICGGGDPTTYNVNNNNLSDLVNHINTVQNNPNILIGTHGAFDVSNKHLFSTLVNVPRIGISLDASYEATRTGRDRNAMKRAIDNTTGIVKQRSKVNKRTYISFTFTKDNWMKLFEIAWLLFNQINSYKFKFNYTMIADDNCPHDPYYPSRLQPSDRINWYLFLDLLDLLNPDFSCFIKEHTRLSKIPEDKNPAFGVKRCGMVNKYVLAAADGYYYPCCVMAAKQTCRLGQISATTPRDLKNRREDFYYNKTPAICREGCRVRDFTLMGSKAWV